MNKIKFFLCLLVSVAFFPRLMEAQPFIDEIREFKKQDSLKRPPSEAILFVGSSSFRLWATIQDDFPGHRIINRGFGGSSLPDVIRYANDIIFPYKPKEIVIYCGENDLAASNKVTGQLVAQRFTALFNLIRSKMPNVPIVFVSIKPSPSRQKLFPEMKKANMMIRKFLSTKGKAFYVDVFDKMLAPDGSPMQDIFREDMLHMNLKGYDIWVKAIRPYLLK